MKGFLRIVIDERFQGSLGYIHSKLGSDLVSIKSSEDYSKVLAALSEVIVVDCKAWFIEHTIQLSNVDDVSKHVFVRTLCAFDYETDKMIAEELLSKGEMLAKQRLFLLGSFYDFCLDILKKRWSEVCILTNENISCLACKRNFDELLKFMIASVDCRVNEVFLVERGNGVEVLDRGLKAFDCVHIRKGLTNELQVLETLITLGPRRIVFLGNDNEIFSRVRILFENSLIVAQERMVGI